MGAVLCLMLVEGPFDRQRLSVLSELFDKDKLVLIPFGTDVLQIKDYYKEYRTRINSILSKEKTHELTDFAEIVQVCDTDGCFISDDKIFENNEISKIVYGVDTILVRDKTSIINAHKNKRENINQILESKEIILFYNSTNVDHAFDNIQNPSNFEKRTKSMDMFSKYKNDGFKLLEILVELCPDLHSYENTWNYIKEGNNSLKRSSNILHFVIKHFDELKEIYQIRLRKLIEKGGVKDG